MSGGGWWAEDAADAAAHLHLREATNTHGEVEYLTALASPIACRVARLDRHLILHAHLTPTRNQRTWSIGANDDAEGSNKQQGNVRLRWDAWRTIARGGRPPRRAASCCRAARRYICSRSLARRPPCRRAAAAAAAAAVARLAVVAVAACRSARRSWVAEAPSWAAVRARRGTSAQHSRQRRRRRRRRQRHRSPSAHS